MHLEVALITKDLFDYIFVGLWNHIDPAASWSYKLALKTVADLGGVPQWLQRITLLRNDVMVWLHE